MRYACSPTLCNTRRLDLDRHNSRRRHARRFNRLLTYFRAIYPNFTEGQLVEVMFDRLRPIILRGDYFVLWRGGRGFRDNDAMQAQLTLALAHAGANVSDLWEWQGLRIRAALVGRGHLVVRR